MTNPNPGGTPITYYKPSASQVRNDMVYAFGHHGNINIHVDVKNDIPFNEVTRCFKSEEQVGETSLERFQETYLSTDRTGIYHYIVAAHSQSPGNISSGISCKIGNDALLITLRVVCEGRRNHG